MIHGTQGLISLAVQGLKQLYGIGMEMGDIIIDAFVQRKEQIHTVQDH
jgi:hypothetical protein